MCVVNFEKETKSTSETLDRPPLDVKIPVSETRTPFPSIISQGKVKSFTERFLFTLFGPYPSTLIL